MKKIIVFFALFSSTLHSFAQPISRQSIEDSVIGWMKVYNFKGVKETKKVDDKLYSAAQLSICDSFANWMQASYLPKGALGDIKKAVSEKLGLYNQYTAARPQSYGAYSKSYFELKYNSSHNLVPETNSNIYWGVFANQVPGDWPVKDLCTSSNYYFIMPTAVTEEDDKSIKMLLDISKKESIKPYISFWVKNMGFGGGVENVLLCKDNISPFIKVTKGEYLQAWEVAIPLFYEAEKKKISEAEQGDQKRIAVAVKYLDEKIEKFKTCLINNKEKYKNHLSEVATTSKNHSINDLNINSDIFSGHNITDPESSSVGYPVYKIDPQVAALCKKDKPQWIMISWQYYVVDPTEKQQHEAIINNFNFDYVYNFFFNPEKIKGRPYTPLQSPATKQTIIVAEVSETSKKNKADKSIHFFEDFSTSGIGNKPIGWRSANGSDGGIIEKPEGLSGNWVMITGNTITPNELKKPLPQNFTLSYDLVASQNFTWGAKGLTIQISKETSPGNPESFIKLKLRPGFDGKDGEAMIETKFPFPPNYATGSKWFVAPGFSNNKKNNRIAVTIRKKDEMLQVFIDNKIIAEYEKAIPATHSFNAISFSSGNSGTNDKYYISNIKITKD
jgi:hypothetical protein